jgi:hypothetical protein
MASGVWFRFKFVKQGGVLAMSDYTPFVRLQGAAIPSNISETSATLVDATAEDAPIDYVLTLNDPLTLIYAGQSVDVQFVASGGTAPYTYTGSGLPAGLSLATDGRVTGATELVGTFPYTITATDVRGATVTEEKTLLVLRLPATIALDDTLADGMVGDAYTGTVAASGGTEPYIYAVTSGALPAGLTLASNGAVTGTPTTAETAAFTVTATDANGDTGSRAYSVDVTSPIPASQMYRITFQPESGTEDWLGWNGDYTAQVNGTRSSDPDKYYWQNSESSPRFFFTRLDSTPAVITFGAQNVPGTDNTGSPNASPDIQHMTDGSTHWLEGSFFFRTWVPGAGYPLYKLEIINGA